MGQAADEREYPSDLTESVYKVVLQKSTPAQILFFVTNMKDEYTNLCGNSLFEKDLICTFCEINPSAQCELSASMPSAFQRKSERVGAQER